MASFSSLTLLVVSLLTAAAVSSSSSSKPNLVMIVIDDLGYNDTALKPPGAGHSGVITPKLERLREDGVLLFQHYVFKFCSPSRSQFLTGRYAYHLGQQTYMNLNPETAKCGVSTNFTMLPALLKRAGYRSFAIGKWHQGHFRREYTPTYRGFNRFLGFYAGGQAHSTHVTPYTVYKYLPSWWTPADREQLPAHGCGALWDLHNDSGTHLDPPPMIPADKQDMESGDFGGFAAHMNGTYSSEMYAAAFEDLVDEHVALSHSSGVESPLFAYVAFHNVHLPLEAPERYRELYRQQWARGFGTVFAEDEDRLTLAAMVTAVDVAVGRVISKLEAAGLYENTLVVVSSDNSAPVCVGSIPKQEGASKNCGGSNGLLRGSKMTDWEGGVRGLALISGGLVPQARRGGSWSGLISNTDWYTAFATLAGLSAVDLAATGPVPADSVPGVLDALLRDSPSPRRELVHNIFGESPGAIRIGDLKLVSGDPNLKIPYNGYNGWNNTGPSLPACADSPCLFNISQDPSELHDLSADMPDLLASMLQRYNELRASEVSLEASHLCPADARGLEIDGCEANEPTGVWGPWLPSVSSPPVV